MEPWLSYNGIEIANHARTAAYVQAGLGPPGFEMAAGCTCDEMTPVGGFVNPIVDDAPWFDAAKGESDSFLGFVPITLNLIPKVSRSTVGAGISGVSMGRLGLGGALVQVSGWLVAATEAGMEYGERWLIAALRNQCVAEGCDVGTLCVLPACPEGVGYSASSFRTLYRAGLIDYTPAQPVGDIPSWFVRVVAFQLQSELPYMYEDPIPLALAQPLGFGAVTAGAVTGAWPGEAGVRLRVAAGQPTAVGPVRITGQPHRAGAGCAGQFQGASAYWNVDRQFSPLFNVDRGLAAPLSDTIIDQTAYQGILDISGHGWKLQGWGALNGAAYRPILRYDAIKYLWVPDVNSNLSTPDSVGLSITTALAIEVDVEVPSWSYGTTGFFDLCSKEGGATNFSWLLRFNQSAKTLEFIHSATGTAQISASVSWAPRDLGFLNDLRSPPRYRIRVELDTATGTKRFYVSTDGVNYALIGTTAGAATSVFDSTAAVYFCGRAAGGYFRGKFYSGRVAAGLWSNATATNRAQPNIDTQGVHTSATFSDGTNTWTINRPATGAKAALVWRSMALIGPDSQNEGYYINYALQPGTINVPIPHIGQLTLTDSFTVIVYGKVWGTTTGQTLMANRLSTGGGWELRRGAVANTLQAILVDTAGHTVTASAAGALTPGTPFVAVLRRDVAADTLTALLGIQAGAPVTDTTTNAPDPGDNNVPLVLGAVKNAVFVNGVGTQAGGLSQADMEYYGGGIWYRALTNAELTTEITNLGLVGAPPAALTTYCFDVTVPAIPAGTELLIDGATHTVELRRTADGVLVGGLDMLSLSAPLSWPEMGPCTEVCWSVDAGISGSLHNTDSKVTIDQLNREV